MDIGDVKDGLNQIGRSYPDLHGLLRKMLSKDKGDTLGNNWSTIFSKIEQDIFFDVCEDFAHFKLPPPDNPCHWGYVIKAECRKRQDDRIEKRKSMEIRLMAQRPPSGMVKLKKVDDAG